MRGRRRIVLLATILLGLLAIVAPVVRAEDRPPLAVAIYDRSAGPTAQKFVTASGADKGVSLGPDAQACISNFVSYTAPFNALVAQQWPTMPVAGELAQLYREKSTGGVFALGERRLAVVVNAGNSINTIRITSLHQILAALDGDSFYQDDKTRLREKEWPLLYGTPATWSEFGSDSATPVRVYSEGRSSWTAETLGVRCLKRVEWSLGSYRWGQRPLRKDIVECIDADDVVKRVRRDPAGIGFVQYTGQRLKGVKLLAVEDDFPDGWPGDFANPGPLLPIHPDGTVDVFAWNSPEAKRPTGPIAMKLGRVLQPEYPLSEPLLLFVHPKAPQNVKDFAAWCVSEPGAAIAETLGLITPFADAQTKAQQRLADLRAGKGEILTVCGQGALYYLARDLTLAFTRSTRPVELKYEPETTDRLATLFLQGHHSVLLSWGTPIGVLPAGNPKLETRNPKQEGKPEAESTNPVGPAAPAARSVPTPNVPASPPNPAQPDPRFEFRTSDFVLPRPDLARPAPQPPNGSRAAQWHELERKGLRSYTIGARVAAVVVNAKTGKTSLTPNELKMILAGQVRDWRALSVPDGQLQDNTIKLFMPASNNPIFPLTYLAPAASPCAAEVFLQSLITPSAQEAMKSQGITPIPPAPAR